jgi:hypothetical protein
MAVLFRYLNLQNACLVPKLCKGPGPLHAPNVLHKCLMLTWHAMLVNIEKNPPVSIIFYFSIHSSPLSLVPAAVSWQATWPVRARPPPGGRPLGTQGEAEVHAEERRSYTAPYPLSHCWKIPPFLLLER